MGRTTHRLRHAVSPDQIPRLRALGFRYSPSRDAYVLRVIGKRLGPVYQVRQAPQRWVEPRGRSAPGAG